MYILDSLKEFFISKSITPTPVTDVDITFSKDSKGVSRMHTQENVLTIFVPETYTGNGVLRSLDIKNCIQGTSKWGYPNEAKHNSWHKNIRDVDIDHGHAIKGQQELIDLDEIKCLVESIRKVERMNAYCLDGKSKCFITQDDEKRLYEEYSRYLSEKNANDPTPDGLKLYRKYEKQLTTSAQVFTHAFITTLLDKYLKPYLINQGISPRQAGWMIESAKKLIVFSEALLTASLQNAALSVIYHLLVKNALDYSLNKVSELAGLQTNEIASSIIENMSNGLGTFAAFMKDPTSITQWGVQSTAFGLGQRAAYMTIRQLPKLKTEPTNHVALFNPKTIIESKQNNPRKLRRRRG